MDQPAAFFLSESAGGGSFVFLAVFRRAYAHIFLKFLVEVVNVFISHGLCNFVYFHILFFLEDVFLNNL